MPTRRRTAAGLLAITGLAAAGLTALAPAAAAHPCPQDAVGCENAWRVTESGAPGIPVGLDDEGDIASFEGLNLTSYLTQADGNVIDLDSVDSLAGVRAVAMSSHGRTLATYQDEEGFHQAIVWDSAAHPLLVQPYAGLPADVDPEIKAVDVADSGALVGTARKPGVGQVATRWSSRRVATQLDPSGTEVRVHAIDNAGVAAGSVAGRAVLFPLGNAVRALPTLPGEISSNAIGVNDAGAALGTITHTTAAGRTTTQVVWSAGGLVQPLARPTGATAFRASEINGSGEVVGTATFPGGSQAGVVWTAPGHPIVLPNPPGVTVVNSAATAINDAGVAAGYVIVEDVSGYTYSQSVTWKAPQTGPVR